MYGLESQFWLDQLTTRRRHLLADLSIDWLRTEYTLELGECTAKHADPVNVS